MGPTKSLTFSPGFSLRVAMVESAWMAIEQAKFEVRQDEKKDVEKQNFMNTTHSLSTVSVGTMSLFEGTRYPWARGE